MPIKMIESFYQCSYSYLSRIEIVQKTSLLPYPNLHIYASIGVELEYFAYWAQQIEHQLHSYFSLPFKSIRYVIDCRISFRNKYDDPLKLADNRLTEQRRQQTYDVEITIRCIYVLTFTISGPSHNLMIRVIFSILFTSSMVAVRARTGFYQIVALISICIMYICIQTMAMETTPTSPTNFSRR